MARIKDASVEQVKNAIDIVALVESYTRLRKSGGRLVGLCPFHQEKTPSFGVSPDRGTFKCFGCGEGGDAIAFVEKLEGVDFVGAIEWLADRFNVVLEYEEASPAADAARKRRERLHALLDSAATFYERYLWDAAAGEPVRAYLASRGLGEEISKEFRLGLSPGGPDMLIRKAREKGFTPAEIEAAGLSVHGRDSFRNRLMFPLADARGKIVGFQARKLREDDPLRGKYVNTREGELFHKSAILYGFNLARAAIAKQDRALVVEGNTDVIALRQSGLEPVIASMGTALTEKQLQELGRLTKRVFLCFDSDAAGEDATLRGMELAVGQGFDVKVVSLPKGKDPADDPAGFEARLADAAPYAVHRVRLELDRAHDKQHAYLAVQEILNGIADSPERQEAWRLANDRLGMPVQLRATSSFAGAALSPRLLDASERLELSSLAGVRKHPKLARVLAELGPEHFDDPLHKRAVAVLVGVEEPDAELKKLFAALDARADAEGIDERTTEQLLLSLRERKLQRELAAAPDDRLPDLQHALAKVRSAIREFA
ncbi:MAG: DNA primase [Gaiellaceae bacterium]